MKLSQWIPEVDRRLRSREDYQKSDRDAHLAAERMKDLLSYEQKRTVMDYMNAVDMMTILRMVEAYQLGLEHGQSEKEEC